MLCVALLPTGDAAYAPSFLTGQGSSLALVGAYALAASLAAHRDHTAAFAACERDLRGLVELNQKQVTDGHAALFPTTAEALERRNARLRALAASPPATERPAHIALTLPEPVHDDPRDRCPPRPRAGRRSGVFRPRSAPAFQPGGRLDSAVRGLGERFGALITVGVWVFAVGTSGMIDASITRSRVWPCALQWVSTTGRGLSAGPMRHVPTAWT